MQNLIVIFIIALVLYFAVKPIIKFKKQKGSSYSCYRCAHNNDGNCDSKDRIVKLKI